MVCVVQVTSRKLSISPMFSSTSFIVLPCVRSEVNCLQGWGFCFSWMNSQLFQYHLLKRPSFPHQTTSVSLSQLNRSYTCGSTSALCGPFRWFMWPSVSQSHSRDYCGSIRSLEINQRASFSKLFWLHPLHFYIGFKINLSGCSGGPVGWASDPWIVGSGHNPTAVGLSPESGSVLNEEPA